MRILLLAILLVSAATITGCATTSNKGTFANTENVSKETTIRLDLASSFLGANKPRRSLQELQVIQSDAKKVPRYHFLLGLTYWRLKEYEMAAESYEQAVELDPKFAEAWNNLGFVYVLNGKPEKAEKAFHSALDILTYQTPERASYNLGSLHLNQEELDKAEKYAKLAIDKNWRYTPAYLLLSNILLRQGKTREAISWLRKGTEADLTNPELPLKLAENLLRINETQEAIKWFRHIIEANPKSDEADVARDYLEFL